MSQQLYEDLLSTMLSGKAYNQKLPSEHQLADEYRITRVAVRQVLGLLEDMGYIISRQGIGRFYRDKLPVIELSLSGDMSFTDKMMEQGIPFHSQNIAFNIVEDIDDENMSQELWAKLGKGPYFKVQRLRVVHNIPVAIHTSYVSKEMFSDIEQQGEEITSMFAYFKQHGYSDLYSSETEYSVGFPLAHEQEIFKCKTLVPILVLESSTCDRLTGKVLEVFKTIYRTDIFKYKVK